MTHQPRVPWQVKYLALVLIWGSSFLLMKVGLESLSAVQISALRILSGAAVLGAPAPRRRRRLPTGARCGGTCSSAGSSSARSRSRCSRCRRRGSARRSPASATPPRRSRRCSRRWRSCRGSGPPVGGSSRWASGSSASSRSCSRGRPPTGPTSSGSRWPRRGGELRDRVDLQPALPQRASTSAGSRSRRRRSSPRSCSWCRWPSCWARCSPRGSRRSGPTTAAGCRHVAVAAARVHARARPRGDGLRLHAPVRRRARRRPDDRVDHHLPHPGGVGAPRRARAGRAARAVAGRRLRRSSSARRTSSTGGRAQPAVAGPGARAPPSTAEGRPDAGRPPPGPPEASAGPDGLETPSPRRRQAGCPEGDVRPARSLGRRVHLAPEDLAGRALGQRGDDPDRARVLVGGDPLLGELDDVLAVSRSAPSRSATAAPTCSP